MSKKMLIEKYTAVQQVRYRDLLKWQKERFSKKKDLTFRVEHVGEDVTPFLHKNQEQTSITFIGHCTFFIQIGGLNILTDPVWATRMGLGKRLHDPGLAIDQLPPIDLVLISHNHYDHLHFGSIKKLPGNPMIFVPKGLAPLFRRKGYSKVQEFSWWDIAEIQDVKITFTPSYHWSRRTLWDLNSSLWGGWVLENKKACIYFLGDSGYHSVFKEIGSKFSIDYALIPIGAYEPEWFMKNQHICPEEAVQCFEDLGAKHFIPMHYDAFRLADETPKEALDRLTAEWEKRQLQKDVLKILKLGETLK